MNKNFFIRKIYEADVLERVMDGLRVFIDERIWLEQEATDTLPNDSANPAWDDKKIFCMENIHGSQRLHNQLFKLLIA